MTTLDLLGCKTSTQTNSEKANWSAPFVIQYVNLFQQPGSSNLIGLKLEVGMAS